MTGSLDPVAQPSHRQLAVDVVFGDEADSADRRARAILYLRYRRGGRDSILALVPRTLRMDSDAFSDVMTEPGVESSREKVGLVQPCGLSKKVFGRIQLDNDAEPHTPADLPDWEQEGSPIDPDIRVSEDVFVVNDHTVAESGEATRLGYVVAANTEVSLLFEDRPLSPEESVEYAAEHSVVDVLHVIKATKDDFLDFMGCIVRNRRARNGVLGAVIAANTDEKLLIVAPLPAFSAIEGVSVYNGPNQFPSLPDAVTDRQENDDFAPDDTDFGIKHPDGDDRKNDEGSE